VTAGAFTDQGATTPPAEARTSSRGPSLGPSGQPRPLRPLPADARIALLSPCGWGNLGDAAIIDSAIAAIRRRLPAARPFGLTLNPADTIRRHGIPAFTCSGFSRPHYGISEPRSAPASADTPTTPTTSEVNPPAAPPARRRVQARLREAARSFAPAREAWNVASMVRADLRHRRARAPELDGLDLLVVAGGGQLDEFWGGPLGHPYVLWRWVRAARRAGGAAVVLSVGTGDLTTSLGRFLVDGALRAATYVSFRDDGSRALASSSWAAQAPVVPDLAYALPVAATAAPRSGGDRASIAVSPIAYCDPRVWPVADAARYADHVAAVADFVAGLGQRGHRVVLFATDGPDERVVSDVVARLAGHPAAARERLSVRRLGEVAALMALYAEVDAVVASRLHGLILAHVAGRPALALSYERKVETLMRTMGQDDLCVPIEAFTAPLGLDRLAALLARCERLEAAVARRTREFRAAVESQYDLVLGAEGPS
jgi:polysaccharide pyruvyl transferase WcaK-like protein